MNNICTSIIVPIYNKERHLSKCIRSILEQTRTDFELILVDDASTDASTILTKKFKSEDSRIKIVNNINNRGLLNSRIIGIEQAIGKYTMFVDADDWIAPESLELLLNATQRLDVDMTQMRFTRRFKKLSIKYKDIYDSNLCDRKISGSEFNELVKYIGIDSPIAPSCWGKLYKTELLKEMGSITFNQFWGEDQIFNIHFLRIARSIAFIDFIGYNYRWGGETSHYRFSMLNEYANVHSIKILLGQDEQKCNEEIMKLLNYHIRQLYSELRWTREAIALKLHEELRRPFWQKFNISDIDGLIDSELNVVHENPLRYFAKRLIR